MPSELLTVVDQFIDSNLWKLTASIFVAMVIWNFLNYWVTRIMNITKLNAMNVLADERWVHINGVRGVAERKGGFVKVVGEKVDSNGKMICHGVAYLPLNKVVEDYGAFIPKSMEVSEMASPVAEPADAGSEGDDKKEKEKD